MTYRIRKTRTHWVFWLVAVLTIAVIVGGILFAFQLGFNAGEQRVKHFIHVDSVTPSEDGRFAVVLGYEDQTILHVFYPWWMHQDQNAAFAKGE